MILNKVYYNAEEIAELLNIELSTVYRRIKKLNLSACIEDTTKKGDLKPKNYYSIDKLNLISNYETKEDNYIFIISDFNKVEKFIKLESKINN